jgi:hypothetical protein
MNRPKRACILLLPGIDEQNVLQATVQLRALGMSITFVGLNQKVVTGCHGIGLAPDMSIEDLMPVSEPLFLLFLDSRSASVFLTEPRLYRLIVDALSQDSVMATMFETTQTLQQTGFVAAFNAGQWLCQQKRCDARFFSSLIDSLAHANID